jgi:hypothetical protein
MLEDGFTRDVTGWKAAFRLAARNRGNCVPRPRPWRSWTLHSPGSGVPSIAVPDHKVNFCWCSRNLYGTTFAQPPLDHCIGIFAPATSQGSRISRDGAKDEDRDRFLESYSLIVAP